MAAPSNNGPRTLAMPVAAIVLLLGLLTSAEGRRYTPYYDAAGILTVCDGITGPDVVQGKTYTDAECDTLGQRFVERMAAKIGRCVGPLTFGEWVAWGHFTYNIGTTAFCNSTAARLLRTGDHEAACRQMPRWRFVTIDGVRRDCSVYPWTKKCGGIPKRRALEQSMCLDAL